MSIEFSGWDSALGTEPSVKGLDAFKNTNEPDTEPSDRLEETPAQQRLTLVRLILGWGFLCIMMVGAAALLFMRTSIARSVTAVVVSISGGAALLLNHVALRAYMESSLAKASKEQAAERSEFFPDLDIASLIAVDSRWGLWVALAYLGVFATANALMIAYRLWGREELLRRRRLWPAPTPPGWPAS